MGLQEDDWSNRKQKILAKTKGKIFKSILRLAITFG